MRLATCHPSCPAMPPSLPPALRDPLAAAFRYYERRQEVAAHNLANVDTAAFKGERVFARVLGAAAVGPAAVGPAAVGPAAVGPAEEGPSVPVPDAATDLRQGPLMDTGAPLDLALSGPGFFVVATPGGERWTRGGSFSLAVDGSIQDATGAALLGPDGPIRIPAGAAQITLDGGGRMLADGRVVGHLRLEMPLGPVVQLAHEAGGHAVPTAPRVGAPGTTMVRQGMREGSNVNALSAMVDLIGIQRAYAALGKAHATREAVEDQANELGKPV
ncbi:flagellar hook-basal body protein [Roseisolibacter agri]|uniref:Flagellar basal-body rod protein FlgF n=1 Tax=Roseisolibacter agri TaxID=2014610 RepID=A0AA37QE92_9BACT|nr:flagellar hook basal-body protein [Roseisolibacter agri]GLC28201.1 flagellar basal-body rod protein FlgF [Roseisolibacter agri]